jgi:hypothetical protein
MRWRQGTTASPTSREAVARVIMGGCQGGVCVAEEKVKPQAGKAPRLTEASKAAG